MNTPAAKAARGNERLKMVVHGAVQGVGFRPFVFRLADELKLNGWVNNSPQGVLIEVEGPRSTLETFQARLETERPPHSFIQSLESTWLDGVNHGPFQIRKSRRGGGKTALVLPDIATCSDCVRDIFDPGNRRHRYAFTNCTHCGPRFSIIQSLPYDRANTSMSQFPLCPACRAEYLDPRNRRFHAQPIACPVCGPTLEFRERGDLASAGDDDALLAAVRSIRGGKIAAVKGLGGFHLMVDARDEAAVRRLRARKHREEKPFALLAPSLECVKCICDVSSLEERLLRSPESPIVLLGKSGPGMTVIADAVAPGNPNLGVMLPSNPLHHLLMAELGFPVVATSGNLSDEPICTDELEARERLGGIADVFLLHNRPIVRPVDDSIVRVMLGRELILRRSRGYAPLPIQMTTGTLPAMEPERRSGGDLVDSSRETTGTDRNNDGRKLGATILAVGAHLKNTIALAVGDQVFFSQHIGDLETEPAATAFRRVIEDFGHLYDVQPSVLAADLHPDYLSTQFAWERTATSRRGAPAGPGKAAHRVPGLVQVQHHVAHFLSCLAENQVEPPALGVVWDGTGYGPDGTIWGGEFFLAGEEGVRRAAHLRAFPLPGGEAAVKEPRRAALGLLHEKFGEPALSRTDLATVAAFSPVELAGLKLMLSNSLNAPVSSSMGRLFDAVASLIGLRQRTRFEGQAAMELEFAMEGVRTDELYPFPLGVRRAVRPANPGDAALILDFAPLIEAILDDLGRGVAVGRISARFHNSLAQAIVDVAKTFGVPRVALSGGCFQNRYLTERVVNRLREEQFSPYWHQRVPPNDGGIALGQVMGARLRQRPEQQLTPRNA